MIVACNYTTEFCCAFDSTIFLGEVECWLAVGSLRTICYIKGTALYTKFNADNQIIWANIIESLLMVASDVETNPIPANNDVIIKAKKKTLKKGYSAKSDK